MSKIIRSLGTVVAVVLSVVTFVPGVAEAGIGAGAAPSFPGTVTVGQTGLQGSIEMTNLNTPLNTADTNTVCNFGDGLPCPTGAPGITFTPSCGQLGGFSVCDPLGADPGVFQVSATGTGAAGTSCAGQQFNITPIDPVTGQLRFTPVGAPVTLAGVGSMCRVDFTFDVLKMPTIDQDPGTPGQQTVQITDNTQFFGSLTASARGTSSPATTVQKATPAINTIASGGGVLGSVALTDQASVTGLVSPQASGTVSFRLYGPADPTCAGTPVFEDLNVPYPVAGGPLASAPYTPTNAGTHRWVASYNGDANNNAVAGTCGEPTENTVVSKASPTINTTASADVKLGAGALVDTATVAGTVNPQAGATVTFNLYGPNDATCANAPVATSTRPHPVGGGPIDSLPYTPTAPGSYQWVASYSGDSNNNAVAGACGDTTEITAVAKATPVITTDASDNVAIGTEMTDTATVTGRVSPLASTIEFSLYGPNNATCTGTPVFTSFGVAYGPAATSVTSAAFTPTLPGTYRWVATYTGDANNEAVTGTCGDPAETVQLFGSLSRIVTNASAGTFVGDGKALSDVATVLDRVDPDGTGIVDFRLYGPNDATCAGTPVFESLNVAYPANGGSVSSAGFVPTAPGTYRWVATYRGDTNNSGAVGVCGDSTETIEVAPTPSIDTELPATGPGGVAGTMTFGFGLLLAGVALLGVSGRRRRFGNL